MATSCRIGALTGGPPRAPEVEALTGSAGAFGMVFQLRDDVLDVVASDDELGKPAGQDLAEGIYTLPCSSPADPEIGPELRTLLGQPPRPARAGQGPGNRRRVAAASPATDRDGPRLRRRGRRGARRGVGRHRAVAAGARARSTDDRCFDDLPG